MDDSEWLRHAIRDVQFHFHATIFNHSVTGAERGIEAPDLLVELFKLRFLEWTGLGAGAKIT